MIKSSTFVTIKDLTPTHDAHIGLFEFSRLQRTLSGILGCNVDLATPEALHKDMKGRIMEEAVRAA